jgi:arylsulfatase A-like enzyme
LLHVQLRGTQLCYTISGGNPEKWFRQVRYRQSFVTLDALHFAAQSAKIVKPYGGYPSGLTLKLSESASTMTGNIIARESLLRSLLLVASVLCLGGKILPAAGREDAATGPNVVVIVSDDQGYADSSCYDHPEEVSTPAIDRLAAEGVRFTNGYASAYVCAPTRAGLLTGRYQQRFGFYTAGDSRTGMPTTEITIADVLIRKGYATAIIGKWHVGLEPKYRPLQRGFDEFYGFLGHGAHDYFELGITSEHNSIYRNHTPINETGYLTDNLAREAVSFIERHQDRPFLLYLPFNAVHWPLQAPDKHIDRFDTGDRNRDVYLAMLTCMDEAIDRVLEALKRTDVDENTLIIFFSDNGGARKNFADNGVLRDYKQTVYEGGIRVPFIVRWPARLPQGMICHEPVISLDVLPTVCAAAGAELPGDRVYDGRDMLPVILGRAQKTLHEALFWYDGANQWAVRAGKWKLLSRNGYLELYDLKSDIGEKNNLKERNPHVAERLQQAFEKWKSQLAPSISKSRRQRRVPASTGTDAPKKRGSTRR